MLPYTSLRGKFRVNENEDAINESRHQAMESGRRSSTQLWTLPAHSRALYARF
jgi:hypothetical protein